MPRTSKRNITSQKQYFKIFKEASNYTLNEYWKNLMNKFYLGEFPEGITYSDYIMRIDINRRNKVITFPNNPPEFCNTFIVELKKFNFSENKENSKEKSCSKIAFNSWKDVRNHSLKERMIREYSKNACRMLGLKESSVSELISKINLGLMFKSVNIIMKNGKIHDVSGLDLVDGHFVLSKQNYNFKQIQIKYNEKDNRIDYPRIWKDYIEQKNTHNKHQYYKRRLRLIKANDG